MTLEKKKLLIVEDNETIARQISEILSGLVDECHLAFNGKLGLDFLRENPDVSCVVSDIMMPEMNGIDFIKSLRLENNLVPFIFFSSLGEEILLKEVVEYGPIDYITKPNLESLFESVEQAFRSNFYRIDEGGEDDLTDFIDDTLGDIIS